MYFIVEPTCRLSFFDVSCINSQGQCLTFPSSYFFALDYHFTNTGNMTGVVSERDYVCKVALLGRTSHETKVKEIATAGPNIITATADESVEVCMEKMMNHGIRHLPIVEGANKVVVGMVSIKDLVKTVIKEKEKTIKTLSDFALGRGGHFTSD
jgi:CBS domain-containing protein